MKQKYFLKLLLTLFIGLNSSNSFSQLAVWDFTGSTLVASTSDTNTTVSDATENGLTSTGSFFSCNGDAWSPSSWNTTGTINTSSDYAEYAITAKTGFNLTITGFTFSARRSNAGPQNFSIRSSNDSYTSDLLTGTISTSCAAKGGAFGSSITVNAGNSLSIRIYGYGASSTGNMRMDDVTITGSSAADSSDTSLSFVSSTSSVSEDGTSIDVCVAITNEDVANPTTIEVALDGSSTALNPSDYTVGTAFPTTLTFPAGSTANQCITINLTNDGITEVSKTVVLNLQNPLGGSSAALGSTTQHTLTINDDDLPNLIINEVLADPHGTSGDANGDGTTNTVDDEFIELYNNDGSDLDISGYYIQDAASGGTTRHTFPSGTIVPNNQTIVIFGGGSIVGVPGLAQLSSTGTLAINNGAETLTLYNSSDLQITQVVLTGATDQSQAREPDLTGAFVDHSSIAGNTVDFSPGKDNTDNSNFTPLITWDGSDSSVWSLGANWDTGSSPTSSNDILIPSGMPNEPNIGSSIAAVGINLTVNSGAVLSINSGGSLILNRYGRSIGDVSFYAFVNDNDWHLLSIPVVGETYDASWISSNLIDDTTSAGTNIGIATYSNTTDANGDWIYVTDATNTGSFNVGQGYSIKRHGNSSPIIITGTVKTDDLLTSIDIGNAGTGTENRWNLVGNPYLSHILVSDLITANSANLTDTHEMVYVWDNTENAGTGGYKALTGTDYIHPGQGFFVNADNSTADNFTITETMQSDQNGITFYRTSNNPSIKLMISDGTDNKSTEINYSADKTTALDPSFDVGTFTGQSSSLNVFTHLVSNSQGVNFTRQALPNNDYENIVIPVGLKASSGKEITFTSETLNLPTDLKVFLEDKETNTFTRLDLTNSEYKITLAQDLNGIGRFYIHTTTGVLDIDKVDLNTIHIYKFNKSILRIVGLQQENANVKLFNILGKQMMNTSFNSNGVKDISLPKLATGVYIIQLETNTGKLNKKIILD